MIFHIYTCDDVTLVNEKSIVSCTYMKSNKKCVFNVNYQYLHKQAPTAYFNMMLPEWGEYEIGKKKLRSISREQPYFSDHFHSL